MKPHPLSIPQQNTQFSGRSPSVLPHTTLIFLSHRLHSLTWVDRILVFDAGRIVQDGTHELLRKQIGLYRVIYSALLKLLVASAGNNSCLA